MEIVNSINDALWSYVITIVLVGAAIYFTVRSRGVQFRFLKDALRIMAGRDRNTHKSALAHPKKIGSFKAFSVSLASRVGTGNLAGEGSAPNAAAIADPVFDKHSFTEEDPSKLEGWD